MTGNGAKNRSLAVGRPLRTGEDRRDLPARRRVGDGAVGRVRGGGLVARGGRRQRRARRLAGERRRLGRVAAHQIAPGEQIGGPEFLRPQRAAGVGFLHRARLRGIGNAASPRLCAAAPAPRGSSSGVIAALVPGSSGPARTFVLGGAAARFLTCSFGQAGLRLAAAASGGGKSRDGGTTSGERSR